MYDFLLAALILITLFLAVRVTMKFREISGWKPDDDMKKTIDRSPPLHPLGDLNIEPPSLDSFDSLNSTEPSDPPGQVPPPKIP